MGQTESRNRIVLEGKSSKESVSILLSDNVFDRLINLESKSAMTDSDPKTVTDRVSEVNFQHDAEVEPVNNPAIADKESEFTKNKNYWKKRLEDLQETHEKIKQVLETEKEKGFKDVEESMPKSDAEMAEHPCQDTFSEVASCYQSNSSEPLVCDKQVTEFVTCLRNKRAEVVSEDKQ